LKYKFRPNIWMTLATAIMLGVCIKLGLWQYNKADSRRMLQTQLNARLTEPAVALPAKITGQKKQDLESWRYKRVKFSGVYDTKHQLLLDNQVQNTVAGFHVLTPMQVQGSNVYVLVNRGWVARTAAKVGEMPKPPEIDTPLGSQQIEGDIALPASKFFTMDTPPAANGSWQPVWQNMDMARYAKSVPFAVQPFVVRLDAKSNAGGFVRSWPPPGERVTMHLGYAYQWFGFALTLLVIYIVLNIKQKNIEKVEH
jgi:surfeit locus 1 family protein